MALRNAHIQRQTTETDIDLRIDLDGTGRCTAETGVGFFDHMLNALARHSHLDLDVVCKGDLHVDAHHTVEDVGICLGAAITEALGDKAGIRRFGSSFVPMDEALARAVVDLSGRPYLVYEAPMKEEMVGDFPSSLGLEFFRSIADHARCNLHIDVVRGENAHHCLEAIFKATGRALRQAVEIDPSESGVPSTKGVL